MAYSEFIKEIAENEVAPMLRIAEHGCKNVYSFELDCSDLQDFNCIDIRNSIEHQKLFETLASMTGPILYVFDIVSDTSSDDIVNSVREYSRKPDSKKTPAIKKTYSNTKTLYVGKVTKNFWGRIIHHLGFYKKHGTQGLQLFYWAKPLKLKVRVTSFEFDTDTKPLMTVFERKLADKLQPILGKHK